MPKYKLEIMFSRSSVSICPFAEEIISVIHESYSVGKSSKNTRNRKDVMSCKYNPVSQCIEMIVKTELFMKRPGGMIQTVTKALLSMGNNKYDKILIQKRLFKIKSTLIDNDSTSITNQDLLNTIIHLIMGPTTSVAEKNKFDKILDRLKTVIYNENLLIEEMYRSDMNVK